MTSNALRRAMFAEETADGLLVLLTFSDQSLEAPIRIVNNQVNITSRGEEFVAFPFSIQLPAVEDDGPGRARLTITNVTRELGQLIRQIDTRIDVLIEVVRISDFDAVEYSFPLMSLRDVSFDYQTLTGDITSEELNTEPYPYLIFSPAHFPTLFQ